MSSVGVGAGDAHVRGPHKAIPFPFENLTTPSSPPPPPSPTFLINVLAANNNDHNTTPPSFLSIFLSVT